MTVTNSKPLSRNECGDSEPKRLRLENCGGCDSRLLGKKMTRDQAVTRDQNSCDSRRMWLTRELQLETNRGCDYDFDDDDDEQWRRLRVGTSNEVQKVDDSRSRLRLGTVMTRDRRG
ncbi:hypothetical protein HanIR_Chr04g0201011 [Helianthus annuus]|nr:hypothetical protein HanIR_Chr04g0201011 [Helianthus annuus]